MFWLLRPKENGEVRILSTLQLYLSRASKGWWSPDLILGDKVYKYGCISDICMFTTHMTHSNRCSPFFFLFLFWYRLLLHSSRLCSFTFTKGWVLPIMRLKGRKYSPGLYNNFSSDTHNNCIVQDYTITALHA